MQQRPFRAYVATSVKAHNAGSLNVVALPANFLTLKRHSTGTFQVDNVGKNMERQLTLCEMQ